MAYATVEGLRTYLDKVPAGEATDAILERMLDVATRMVDGELGFSFGAYGEATERDIQCGHAGQFLYLPAYEAKSLTGIVQVSSRGTTSETETAITDYVEETRWRLYRHLGWTRRAWYRATGAWGVGPAPDEVTEMTLEVAVNLWQGKAAGGFDVTLGAEGQIAYHRALSWAQRAALAPLKQRYGRAL